MEEYIRRERALICDIIYNKRDMCECVSSVRCDGELYKLCMRCLCSVVYGDVGRRRAALEMLGSVDRRAMRLPIYDIGAKIVECDVLCNGCMNRELYCVLVCDDADGFREWCVRYKVDEGMLLMDRYGCVDRHVVHLHGALWYAVEYGCERIFECICGMVDMEKFIGSGKASRLVVCSIIGGSMRIIDRLCGYGLDYCMNYSVDEICAARNEDVVYWWLCRVNKNESGVIKYSELVALLNAYNYGVIEKYDLHVEQSYSELDECDKCIRIDGSVCTLQTIRERCVFSDGELCELCVGMIKDVVYCGEYMVMVYMRDVLGMEPCMHTNVRIGGYMMRSGCERDCTLAEYVIMYGDDRLLDVFGVSVHRLPLESRAMLLLSECDKLFGMGLCMCDVVCDCYNELCYCIMYMNKCCERAVRILYKMIDYGVDVKRVLQRICDEHYCDRWFNDDIFDKICDDVGVDVVKKMSMGDAMQRRMGIGWPLVCLHGSNK